MMTAGHQDGHAQGASSEQHEEVIGMGSPAAAAGVAAVILTMLCALIWGWKTPEVVVFLALLTVWNAGLLSNQEALSGFHNPGALVIGALFVVTKSVELSRVGDRIARYILGLGTSFTQGFLRLMALTLCMSAFLNNVPVVALIMPIAGDWAHARGFAPRQFFMPVSFVSALGGILTTLGGGTNLVIQGLLFEEHQRDASVKPLLLFEPAYIGLPLAVAGILYLAFAAPLLLTGRQTAAAPLNIEDEAGGGGGDDVGETGDGSMGSGERDRSDELVTEVEVTECSELVGEPLALVLAKLGLPIDTLVKAWRRQESFPPTREGASAPIHAGEISGEPAGGCSLKNNGEGWGRDEESNAGGGWDGNRNRGGAAASSGVAVSNIGGRGGILSSLSSLRRRAYARLESDGSVDGRDRPARDKFFSSSPASASVRGAGAAALSVELTAMTPSPREMDGVLEKETRRRPSATQDNIPSIVGATDGHRSETYHILQGVDVHATGSTSTCNSTGNLATGSDGVAGTSAGETLRAGDVLVLSCSRDQIMRFYGSVVNLRGGGLRVLGVCAQALGRHGTTMFEVTLSGRGGFVNRSARRDHAFFEARYGCTVVGFRSKTRRVDGSGRPAYKGVESCRRVGSDGGVGGGEASGRVSDRAGLLAAKLQSFNTDGRMGEIEIPRIPSGVAEKDTAETHLLQTSNDDNDVGGRCDFRQLPCSSDPHLSPFPRDDRHVGAGGISAALQSLPSEIAPPKSKHYDESNVGRDAIEDCTKEQHKPGPELGEQRRRGEFAAGDVVLILANEHFMDKYPGSREFLANKKLGCLPEPATWFHFCPLVIFVAMLAWVFMSDVHMVRAVFAACAVVILGGWIDASRAVGYVDWPLLVLIGSALGLSKAIVNSGLARYAADAVRESGISRSASIYVLFAFTMLCTELVTNNAAAALAVPIALSMAQELEASYKPFVMTVLMAASCSFLTPIGTPTNVMVWKPGGYKFQDYAKLGAPLSLVYWFAGSTLIPVVFPFEHTSAR